MNRFINNVAENTMSSVITDFLDNTQVLDCLVGYFYLNGFEKIIDSLTNVKEINVLVGMGIDFDTMNHISKYSMKSHIEKRIKDDLNSFEDTKSNSDFIFKLNELLTNGKIKVRFFNKPNVNLHAKMYVFTYKDTQNKKGSIIVGSSNLSYAGLNDNIEMNVLLEDDEDYCFGKEEFERLWDESDDYTDTYLEYLKNSFVLNDVSPYEFYLKFVYEFYRDYLDDSTFSSDSSSIQLTQYQIDAVNQAKRIVDEHNGVFLSDVVGLGKTFMGAALLKQLGGKSVVIAPPKLIDMDTIGSWKHVLNEFSVDYTLRSSGKIIEYSKREYEFREYDNILIDESHLYRNENLTYNSLKKVCQGKKVILLSATPYNNKIDDLLNQIKLFQNVHKSTLPDADVKDLNKYFKVLNKKLDDHPNDKSILEEVNKDIREKVLKYLMVRRTRNDIEKYYKEDLEKNKFKLAETKSPKIRKYKLKNLSNLFDDTYEIIAKKLTYARYIPLSKKYCINKEKQNISQINMKGIIKTLLFKRLESDIHSFKETIDRLISSHKNLIKNIEQKGTVFTSKSSSNILFSMDEDIIEKIEEEVKKGRGREYPLDDFNKKFFNDLKLDLKTLKDIKKSWEKVDESPKVNELINLIKEVGINKHIVIFTEFTDTADHLKEKLDEEFPNRVVEYTGDSSKSEHKKIIYNFDANVDENEYKEKCNILISTDVLAHGVNLHRASILINYDIPWNPTKIMQRLGRLQRIHKTTKKLPKISLYSFFPVNEIDEKLGLTKIVEKKLNSFIDLLDTDTKYLGNEEINKHDESLSHLTNLNLNEEIIINDLYYVEMLKDIKNNKPELFEKIINLSNKTRIRRKKSENNLISLFKVNNFNKIILNDGDSLKELTFDEAIGFIEADESENSFPIKEDSYFRQLEENKEKLKELIYIPSELFLGNNEKKLLNKLYYTIYNSNKIKTEEKKYFIKLIKIIKEGTLTKKEVNDCINNIKTLNVPHRIYNKIYHNILGERVNNIVLTDKENEYDVKLIISQQSTTE